ncbi:hypothetical protein PVAND_013157 [Polypedilum vanderplanki]|uniref:Centriolar and ciliogenesis-associated protein HYLS1 C-terminal domain-containing protein n=1 Tax=Polypedilum vanderplanki TaxID=319348 RepID=A0A9J6CNM3_POLVA|nr:hypothetical protein PVAND_013157 [Polypedilum vanderplanki]
MDLHVSLDAREVLFHLNLMGYHSITREQLKSFMTDLKKLIKYESNSLQSTTNEAKTHAPVSHSHNIERLFELHTKTSKLKQREKHPVSAAASSKDMNKENDKDNNKKLTRNKSSGEIILRTKENAPNQKRTETQCHDINEKATKKRNPPPQRAASENLHNKENVPTKMWIRPKSAQTSRPQISIKKRNDPVALYQEYQKDWERFRANICESSRSELRWKIREKMLSNH